jgi:hypothetical protein
VADYKDALAFQELMIASTREQAWTKATVEAMRNSGLEKRDALGSLTLITYLVRTPEIYYFPREAFERLEKMGGIPDSERIQLAETFPTNEGLLIFEDNILLTEGDPIAYSAVLWKKNVASIKLSDREAESQATAIIFMFSMPYSDEPDAFYLSPILLAIVEEGETVVTPAYNYKTDHWKKNCPAFLNRVGTVCEFMRMRIADTTVHKHRTSVVHGRKKLTQVSSVKIVTLRAMERTEQPTPSEHHSVDWSCRWTVREHDRHLRDGRIVKVKEHKKGPIGLPEREYAATIYDVSR